jgi:FAD binding domain/Berberine and berberine like
MDRRHFCQSAIGAAVAASFPTAQALASALQALTTVSADIDAITGNGAETILQQSNVQDLSDSLRGNLLLPGNEAYETARRVLNESINRHPALVVQPTGVADVRRAVDFARDNDLLLAVKCGGHSYSGKSTCEGGMQLDLSTFRSARIDPASRTAYVAGGSLLGELDHESMALGLVTTAGTVSHTGVGGLTLGGGFGRLARRFGLALDNVNAVDIVTADGELRHASARENPDLYWGVRGGGGNFGVVTSFEFQLHPMQRQVIGGEVVYPLSEARNILSFYADYSANAPDDLYVDLVMQAPAGGADGAILIHICYSGPESGAEKLIAPLRKAGTVVNDGIKATDYVAIQSSWDSSDPRNEGEYLKSGFTTEFSDKLVDALVDGFEAHPERGTTVFFQHSGGAIGRVAADATAFAHRYSKHNMFAVVTWPLDKAAEPHIKYIRRYWAGLEPFTYGYYTNEVGDEPQSKVHANYQGNFERLLSLKKKYDPANLFRLNANIDPNG